MILDRQAAGTASADNSLIERGQPLHDPIQACLSRVLGGKHRVVGHASGNPAGSRVIRAHGKTLSSARCLAPSSVRDSRLPRTHRPQRRSSRPIACRGRAGQSRCRISELVILPDASPVRDNRRGRCGWSMKNAACLDGDNRLWRANMSLYRSTLWIFRFSVLGIIVHRRLPGVIGLIQGITWPLVNSPA